MSAATQAWTLPGVARLVSPLYETVESLRTRIGNQIVGMLAADADVECFGAPMGDAGLFGPTSPVWTVHADPAMFIGGIRALLLQTMHPLAMAGVAEHSDYQRNPLRRLQRTATFVRDTTFGNTRQVDAAIATVRAVHEHVRGIAPDGRPYSASAPDLLRWVHAAEIDSFLKAHSRYGAAPLGRRQKDAYVDQMAEVGLRLGADWLPRSYAALQRYFKDVRSELVAGEQARATAQWLVRTPARPEARVPQMILNAAAIGLLPGWVRRALGLIPVPFVDPVVLLDPLIVRPLASAMVVFLGWALGPNRVQHAAARRFAVPARWTRRPHPRDSRRTRAANRREARPRQPRPGHHTRSTSLVDRIGASLD